MRRTSRDTARVSAAKFEAMRRRRSVRPLLWLAVAVVVVVVVVSLVPVVDASCFAYAPNFITKLIEEQTGISPQGLLHVDTVPSSDKNGHEQPLQPAATALDPLAPSSSSSLDAPRSFLVRTRFPPEPNGFLHLGHAKAVSFNFAVARMFGGVCHMRLDDTNPSKEEQEYVDAILQDVCWIQQGLYPEKKDQTSVPWHGPVRKTSDYFDVIYQCARYLIETGDAYVDSLTAVEMKEYRGTLTEPGRDSPYRTSRSIAENLQLFEEMKDGKYPEGTHVVRAKIDMASPNLNLRDPTLYRIKHESHQATGDTWCIYPMYDFSHPIADALEQITHSLCTLEFEDHRPFYDWTIEKLLPSQLLGSTTTMMTRPQQIEFSRLNVQSTVLSKRKLIQLVQGQYVSGWDDPRMPTLSGMRRRGVPPSALRLFCERVGISKADSNIDLTVLEDCIRETMDATCPRAFCVLQPLLVTITNYPEHGGESEGDVLEEFVVDKHPKETDMGTRMVPFGSKVYIERSDFFDAEGPEGEPSNGKAPKGFKRLLLHGRVRLRYAYVVECQKVVRDPITNEPIELQCTYFPETRAGVTPEGMPRVNGIIHWVEASTAVPCQVNQYDRLFAVEEPGKESGDYLKDLNPHSLQIIEGAVVEPSVADEAVSLLEQVRDGESSSSSIYPSSLSYQFERSGYFALDPSSTGRDNLVLNRVVTLRDTWGVQQQQQENSGKDANRRNRGNANNIDDQGSSTAPKQSDSVIDDERRVAFRAATILSAEPHPEADSLLVCQVDCGDVSDADGTPEPRTVVAGLAGKIPIEEVVGKKVVAVTNLKPAKMRGIESQAMLLAASTGGEDDETVELLVVPDSVPNGELLSFEGKEPSDPDPMLKSKGALKAWDRVKACLRANSEGEAILVQDKAYRLVSSCGPAKTKTLKDAIVQ